jgi:solute carrier family 35 protein F1/2
LLGQAISIILAVAGGTNEVLAEECNVSTPAAYNMAGYALVAILGAIMLRKDMKRDKAATSEEQESFHTADENRDTSFLTANQGHDGSDGDGNEHNDDGVDDDLTLEDDNGPTLRSMFSRNNANGHGPNNHRSSSNKSHGSASKKLRVQYPFLCGMFTIHAKWYYYFAVAFIEAQAYYLLFLAFRYTSFTFVYISDALAIPSAMLFTKLIMKRSYLWVHLIGAAVCIIGIVVNTASDIKPNEDTIEEELEVHISNADHLKGDLYALVGAILLGLDDVLSEILVSDYGGVTEMLFMKGLYGALISVVQMLIFEMDSITALFSPEGSCGLSWRVVLFTVHVVFRALDVWGEMQVRNTPKGEHDFTVSYPNNNNLYKHPNAVPFRL